MGYVWAMIIGILLGVSWSIMIPRMCKKKITTRINNNGGQVIEIKTLSIREQLFCVDYTTRYGKQEKAIVRFSLFFEDKWL